MMETQGSSPHHRWQDRSIHVQTTSKSPAKAEPARQIEDLQIKVEMELERMVIQEREELPDGDFLKREAPKE
jgi:hypothetical protein